MENPAGRQGWHAEHTFIQTTVIIEATRGISASQTQVTSCFLLASLYKGYDCVYARALSRRGITDAVVVSHMDVCPTPAAAASDVQFSVLHFAANNWTTLLTLQANTI
jgi:hypothetical protein